MQKHPKIQKRILMQIQKQIKVRKQVQIQKTR